jgi:hypothetical protein
MKVIVDSSREQGDASVQRLEYVIFRPFWNDARYRR